MRVGGGRRVPPHHVQEVAHLGRVERSGPPRHVLGRRLRVKLDTEVASQAKCLGPEPILRQRHRVRRQRDDVVLPGQPWSGRDHVRNDRVDHGPPAQRMLRRRDRAAKASASTRAPCPIPSTVVPASSARRIHSCSRASRPLARVSSRRSAPVRSPAGTRPGRGGSRHPPRRRRSPSRGHRGHRRALGAGRPRRALHDDRGPTRHRVPRRGRSSKPERKLGVGKSLDGLEQNGRLHGHR